MATPSDKKCRGSQGATEKMIFAQLSNYQRRVLRALADIEALLELQVDLIEMLDSQALHSKQRQESIVLISHLLRDRYGQQSYQHMTAKFKQAIQSDFKLYADLLNAQFEMVSRFSLLNGKQKYQRKSVTIRDNWFKRWAAIIRKQLG